MYEVFGTKAPRFDDKKIIPNRICFGNNYSFVLNAKKMIAVQITASNEKSRGHASGTQHF